MENIQKLKDKFVNPAYEDDKQTIREWERQIRKSTLYSKLAEYDAMKIIVEELNKELDEIKAVLRDDEDQTMEDRKILIYRRKLYEWFIGIFPEQANILKVTKGRIKEELNE